MPRVTQATTIHAIRGTIAPMGRGTPLVSNENKAGEALMNISRMFVVLPIITSKDNITPMLTPIKAENAAFVPREVDDIFRKEENTSKTRGM